MVGSVLLEVSQGVYSVPVATMAHPLKYHMSLQSHHTLSMLAFSPMPYLCYHGNRKPGRHPTGMKLSGKSKDVNSFVDQIKTEEGGIG